MERNSPWRGGVDRDREEQNPRKPRWRLRGEEAWAAWPGGCYRIGLNQDPNPQTVGTGELFPTIWRPMVILLGISALFHQ
jgi:hypothetical protein